MTDLAMIVQALRAAGLVRAAPAARVPLQGVADDSRRVVPGALFCAVQGTIADGHRFVGDAAANGAAAALVTRVVDVDIPQVEVTDSRLAAAVAAAAWFGRPGEALRLVGVTGTNGKSTTVHLIRHLLNAAADVAALGTLGGVDGAGRALPEDTGLTTPGAVQLHEALAKLRAGGAHTVVMETSSHALDQGRTATLAFRAAVYTNLTHDHLDYHGDAETYLRAKLRLSRQLAAGGLEVVNADDPAWEALPLRSDVRRMRFGLHAAADVTARVVNADLSGSELSLHIRQDEVGTHLPLVGEFNVANALAAAAVAAGFGRSPEEIGVALAKADQVAGRMERLVGEPFTVIRDYAHTPDALERVLRALRPMTPARLIALFGCGGDRDRRKRPVMGAIAAREADLAIVTSDNPRTEDPDQILDEIEAGMGETAHVRIRDRRDAIVHGLTLLRPGDCLVLAGKGHEAYQVIGTEKVPFDEPTIVRDTLGRSAA